MKNLQLKYSRKSALGLIFFFSVFHSFGQIKLYLSPEDENISQKIEAFVSGDSPKRKVIYLSSGTYYFTTPINLSSNTSLKGDTSGTKLNFDLSGKGNCINIIGKKDKSIKSVKLNTDQRLKGDLHYFKIYNASPEIELSKWGGESLGKIVQGQLIDNELNINGNLNAEEVKLLGDSILCYRIIPVKNVSISDLSIVRVDESNGQTSNLFFQYAAGCNVSNVSSYMCNYSHITLENCYGVVTNHCKFKNSFSHGNGGKAYGVTMQFGSTANEVSGCLFDSLRHGVVLQLGANRNWIVENYFRNGYWEDVWLPKRASGDIVLHGNYPFMNFIEGNICNNIVIDNSHGLNGPLNIIQHNRTLLYGIYLNRKSTDKGIYIFDNIIDKKGCFKKGFKLRGNPVENCGNLINGKLKRESGDCDHASTKENLSEKMENNTNDAKQYFGIGRELE